MKLEPGFYVTGLAIQEHSAARCVNKKLRLMLSLLRMTNDYRDGDTAMKSVICDSVKWDGASISGVTRRILTYTSECMLVMVKAKPGSVSPPHSHTNVQCGYIMTGSITIQNSKEKMNVPERGCFIIEANEEHEIQFDKMDQTVLFEAFVPARSDLVPKT